MPDLLNINELPASFDYPHQFVRIVELGLTNLEPWWVLTGSPLRDRYEGLKKRYPGRMLVPFATRQDNDDIGCWDLQQGSIVIIHDFASPGTEDREKFPDFYCWFRRAIEDCIAFDLS